MAKLISDVVPPATYKRLPSSDMLIAALYLRGVTIEDIFAKYYEYEAHAGANDDELLGSSEEGQHGLTVGDAQLAGGITPTEKRQPF